MAGALAYQHFAVFHNQGRDDVLWQPGTDHAGIATQMVVVRNLELEGIGLAIEGAADRNTANRKLLRNRD